MLSDWIQNLAQLTEIKEFNLQLIATIASVIIACGLSFIIKHYYLLTKVATFTHKESIIKLVTRYLRPLLTPLLIIIALTVNYIIFDELYQQTNVVRLGLDIASIWLLIDFIAIASNNRAGAVLVGIALLPIVILNFLGLLDDTINFLDHYAVTLGTVRISIYTVIKAIVVLTIVFWLAGAIARASRHFIRKVAKFKSRTRILLIKFLDITIYTIVFLIALNVIGVDLTALAVIGGAIGVGIGFGLQKITSNFISGIILIFERSMDTGDLIELEGNVYGWIRHLGARYTLVETLDGKEIMIPNEDFITGRVVNWTYSNKHARITIPVGVSYKSDLDLVHKILLEAASEYPICLQDPGPVCHLLEFGDSSVNFMLRFWVADIAKAHGHFKPQSDVMFSIWNKFKEHKVEIPFPQRDVHIKNP